MLCYKCLVWDFSKNTLRICHGCWGRRKEIQHKDAIWHQGDWPMTNGNFKGQIVLSALHAYAIFVFLLTTQILIYIYIKMNSGYFLNMLGCNIKSATIWESNHGWGVCKEHYTYYYVPKSSILLAGTGVWKNSSVACWFIYIKIDNSDFRKSLISRINEVYVFSIQ